MKYKPEPVNPLYEDPELNVMPEREEYDELWLHVRGYDFAPVESYARFLHRFTLNLDQSATQDAVPPRTWDIATFKPRSELSDHEYKLKKFHRLIKVSGLPNNIISLMVDMATRHLPAGVELTVGEPDEELIEFMYVPDADLIALKKELEDVENQDL